MDRCTMVPGPGPEASTEASTSEAAAGSANVSPFVSPQFLFDSALASLLQAPANDLLPTSRPSLPRTRKISSSSADLGVPMPDVGRSYSMDMTNDVEPSTSAPSSSMHRRSFSDHFTPAASVKEETEDDKLELTNKRYPSGDVYHGLMLNGKPHSVGRYVWVNGNEYDGRWNHGRQEGQGTCTAHTGERYDGEWKNGKMHGPGIFTYTDGSTYHGVWRNGRKDGIGVFIPPLANPKVAAAALPWSDLETSSSCSSSTTSTTFSTISTPSSSDTAGEMGFFSPSPGWAGNVTQELYIREYRNGRMLRSSPVPATELFGVLGPLRYDKVKRNRLWKAKQQAHQPPRIWEQLIKGSGSYDLVLNLQLGIRWSVSTVTPKTCPTDLQDSEYLASQKQNFPRAGSKSTPAHQSGDFKWKDYCPMVFRKLRDHFGMDSAEYMLSICGENTLQQFGSEGKSGSVFFLTADLRYLIKTMRKSEVKLLLELLPKYYDHMQKYPDSLLTRFCGLHRIKPRSHSKVRFVVMRNILPTNIKFDEKYDLKGSTIGRTVAKAAGEALPSGKTWKDLDLQGTFLLDPYWMEQLQLQMELDCKLLQECRVMDYSLLLAVRFPQPVDPMVAQRAQETEEQEFTAEVERELSKVAAHLSASRMEQQRQTDLLELARLKLTSARAIVNLKPRDSDYLLNQPASLGTLPALMVRKDGSTRECQVFHGIIDFLQEYNMSKKLEHFSKSWVQDAGAISAVDPVFYAERFKAFCLTKVFGVRDPALHPGIATRSQPPVLAHVPRLSRGFREANLPEQLGLQSSPATLAYTPAGNGLQLAAGNEVSMPTDNRAQQDLSGQPGGAGEVAADERAA